MDMDFALFQQVAQHTGDDRNVAARFYDKAVKTDKVNSVGLPIFKNVTYVEIRLKDNNTEVFNQPASLEKIRRFPKEYSLYKLSKEQAKEGTPLEQFAFMTAAEIATCKSRGIFTVEALAKLPEDKVLSLCLENEHSLAQIFMKNANHNQTINSFAEKERKYNEKIAFLQEQVEILQKQIQKQANRSTKKSKKKGDE